MIFKLYSLATCLLIFAMNLWEIDSRQLHTWAEIGISFGVGAFFYVCLFGMRGLIDR